MTPENNQNIPNPRPFFPETQNTNPLAMNLEHEATLDNNPEATNYNTNPLAMNLEHEATLDNNPEATNYVDSAPIPIPDSQ
ncbi:hypothetical protein BB559_002815 [Furculomyces boomerangus]|uniref:Uncharacterized protein n=1 Tax=Furculomyces boomerangus TaxID=61424 RepID=A0A2T9YS71_9FUNG|nr:hypothetical protein BB559_002815 [Furculomyces boomerangus]